MEFGLLKGSVCRYYLYFDWLGE